MCVLPWWFFPLYGVAVNIPPQVSIDQYLVYLEFLLCLVLVLLGFFSLFLILLGAKDV